MIHYYYTHTHTHTHTHTQLLRLYYHTIIIIFINHFTKTVTPMGWTFAGGLASTIGSRLWVLVLIKYYKLKWYCPVVTGYDLDRPKLLMREDSYTQELLKCQVCVPTQIHQINLREFIYGNNIQMIKTLILMTYGLLC